MGCADSARCPLNGRICECCTNREEPADGPYPGMDKPSEKDWDWEARIIPH